MAVTSTFLTKNVQLRLNTGLDEDFNPIYKTRSWAGVKAAASAEDLFEVAEEIGSLQIHTVDEIRTTTVNALEEA
jgi:hypothetical protein